MRTFLDDFVDYYTSNFDFKLANQTIILPSKRSVAALKKTFAAHHNSFWLPEIIDIVSFIKQVSQLEIFDHQEALVEFYNVYSSTQHKKEHDSFENFYSWGSVLINDFNEIDRFLIDSDQFFEHHKSLKTINYFGEEKTEMIKSYIKFWETLPHYYNSFKKHCLEIKTANQGLAYRIASEKIQHYIDQHNRTILFVGFNALNKAEELIVESCLKNKSGYLIWDIDHRYLKDSTHPANTFIKHYKKKWSAFKDHLIMFKSNLYTQTKHVNIQSSPKYIGQAKLVSNILESMSVEDIDKTTIVLSDENLLIPILNSIPDNTPEVNITMGLALNKSPITDFVNLLIEHQVKHKDHLSYETMTQLVNHKLLNQFDFIDLEPLKNYLEKSEALSYSFNELDKIYRNDSLEKQFMNCLQLYSEPVVFIKILLKLLSSLQNLNSKKFEVYLLAYQNIFIKLQDMLANNSKLRQKALHIIFKDLEESEKLSFKGNKDSGLQLMGMLETRLLDFKTVIFTSVNEGILPAGKTENSYITYDLKKQYGLPTHTEKDAIYAYHFFRLLQRAEQCYIIYDNDQTGFNKGEKSRFLSYLEIFKAKNHKLIQKDFNLSTQIKKSKHIEVHKTPEILEKLKTLTQSGLSPTALTTYILNPILFYKRYVLNIKEAEAKDDVINHRDYGTLVHSTIEELYNNKHSLTPSHIEEFSKIYRSILKARFDSIYVKDSYKTGANRIKFEIANASLDRFFEQESRFLKNSNLEIVGIEEPIACILKMSSNAVKLKGNIDRIDKYNNELRIIDLKTGAVDPRDLKFNDFNQLISDYDYAKAFQVLFYALIYSKNHEVDNLKAGIISFKNLNDWFIPLKYDNKQNIDKPLLAQFEDYLGQLISEILNPDIPFKEKDVNFKS